MEYERHLQQATSDMKAAEERLLESGFPGPLRTNRLTSECTAKHRFCDFNCCTPGPSRMPPYVICESAWISYPEEPLDIAVLLKAQNLPHDFSAIEAIERQVQFFQPHATA